MSSETYTAIQLEANPKVDPETIRSAGFLCAHLLERLNEAHAALTYIPGSFTSTYGELINEQVELLRCNLQEASVKLESLGARLLHGAELYTQAEAGVAALFSGRLGAFTRGTMPIMEEAWGSIIAGSDLGLRLFLKYPRGAWKRWLNSGISLQLPKVHPRTTINLLTWPLFKFLTSEARYLIVDAATIKIRQNRLLRNSDSPLERSSGRLSRLYSALEKAGGVYLPTLRIQPVSRTGLSLPGKDLNRDKIAYSLQSVESLLTADNQPLPKAQPIAEISPLLTASSLLERTKLVRDHPQAILAKQTKTGQTPAGEIEVIRYTNPQTQQHSWSVIIKGTQEWGPTGSTPHDMQTNFAALAGARSDQEAAAITALKMAGAQPGDAVEFVGHSQGGIVSADLAANPEINQTYRVTQVVTAGSPVSGIAIPNSVQVLNFEHLSDPVAQLDGSLNKTQPNWLTYSVSGDPTVAKADAAATLHHNIEGYISASRNLENSADKVIAQWNQHRVEALGITENTRAEVFRFSTQRVADTP